jgi:hypothetical protein
MADKLLSIARALDARLLGKTLGDLSTWATWTAVLRAAFGMELSAEELATFASVAGGRAAPRERVRELWVIAGRRSGKSRMAGVIGVYLAVFARHALAAGERGMVLILAGSQDQAGVVFGYCKAFLEASPALKREIVDATRSEIRLKNGITLAIHSNSFRTVRGRTLCGVVFDEVATWRSDQSAQPDTETYSACLPALITTKGMLVGISTGYKRAGLLFEKHRDHFGQDSADVLIVQGGTTTFNRTLTEADIAAQRAADPGAAAAEWDGLFRQDVATFFDDALIDGATDRDRPLEVSARAGIEYRMFVDASGGATDGDAYAVAIAHMEADTVVLDVVRGVVGKFDPARVTRDFAALAKEYGIGTVFGDRYGHEWVSSSWGECGIAYQRTELSKSAIYLEVVPLFARAALRLPDHAKLLRELHLLERRTRRGGKDVVDHPRGEHDDHAAAACGALHLAATLAPSLWSRQAIGEPTEMPRLAEYIMAVMAAGKRDIGVCYFTMTRDRVLHLIDVVIEPPSPRLFDAVVTRVFDLARLMKASNAGFLTAKALVGELGRRGQRAATIDDFLGKDVEALDMRASVHISGLIGATMLAGAFAQTKKLGDGLSSEGAGALFAGSNQTTTLDCAGSGAHIFGSNNTLTLTGGCTWLDMVGSNNTIIVALAKGANIDFAGSNNAITWTSPDGKEPVVRHLGSGNTLTAGH